MTAAIIRFPTPVEATEDLESALAAIRRGEEPDPVRALRRLVRTRLRD